MYVYVRAGLRLGSQVSERVRWLSGRASDTGAKGPGFEPHYRRVVSLSKTFKALQSTGKYPRSSGSVQIVYRDVKQ